MESTLFFTMLFFSVICFLICVYITRWIFGINKIISNLKMQTNQAVVTRRIISKMAEKNGVTEEEIKQIIDKTNVEVPVK